MIIDSIDDRSAPVLVKCQSRSADESFIKDVGSLVERSKHGSLGLRLREVFAWGEATMFLPDSGSPRFSVPLTTARSHRPALGHGVRASATLGRPRVANGPTCLPALRHLSSDLPRFSFLFPLSISLSLFASSFSSLFVSRRKYFPSIIELNGAFIFIETTFLR